MYSLTWILKIVTKTLISYNSYSGLKIIKFVLEAK